MIFVQPPLDNFISHTYIMVLLSHSIDLSFGAIHCFLCKIMIVSKEVKQMIVQITQLLSEQEEYMEEE